MMLLMNDSKNFVTEIDISLAGKLCRDLEEQQFTIKKIPYAQFTAQKSGLTVTLYDSGKLVVQGKEKEDFLKFYLEPEILQTFTYSHPLAYVDPTPRIGIDESGKGDLFGPLCIAGVYVKEGEFERLLKIGVKDSKLLNDPTIQKMAHEIRAHFIHDVVTIMPAKYNELYQSFSNLNTLLAWGHSKAIENLVLKTGCKKVTIDQFASKHVVENALKRKNLSLDLTQGHRGESDPVIAAASILARDAFLQGLVTLESIYGITFPKGAANHVKETARSFIKRHSLESLPAVAKMHFKTVREL